MAYLATDDKILQAENIFCNRRSPRTQNKNAQRMVSGKQRQDRGMISMLGQLNVQDKTLILDRALH